MKTYLFILSFSFVIYSNLSATIIANDHVKTFSCVDIEIVCEDILDGNQIIDMSCLENTGSVELLFKSEVEFLIIKNLRGQIHYQLPVSSKRVRVDMALFENSKNNIEIKMTDSNKIISLKMES